MKKKSLSYRDVGVDIDAKAGALAQAKKLLEATHGPECIGGIGGFGGLFRLPIEKYREPVLVSSTDGVGTKIKVAVLAGRHDTVGQDIVNHGVNDILVQGARPLFFLDYIGTGRIDRSVLAAILTGLAKACGENGCALIGGETAEMPDVYRDGEYDLVGTIVGVVERSRILDGRAVRPGDVIIGLPSTGLHTNGYTLARRILFTQAGLSPGDRFPGLPETVADVLLRIHKAYYRDLAPLLDDGLLHAMAHITGGGFPDNIPRVLPEGVTARIRKGSFEVPRVFRMLMELGPVDEDEAWRVFNMGIGMVLFVASGDRDAVLARLSGAGALVIGEAVAGPRRTELV